MSEKFRVDEFLWYLVDCRDTMTIGRDFVKNGLNSCIVPGTDPVSWECLKKFAYYYNELRLHESV